MAPEKETYTSNQLRGRDLAIEEKHQKELGALQSKFQLLRRNYDELCKTLHDETTRGRRLAERLGFKEVYEALIEIETADHDVSFRNWIIRVQMAEQELEREKKGGDELKMKLQQAEQNERQLRAEKRDLEEKYDDLFDKKERAAERYRADYKTWKRMKEWLLSDEPFDKCPGVTSEVKKKISKRSESLQHKRQLVVQANNPTCHITPVRGVPPLGRTEMESDKENEATPMPPPKRQRLSLDTPVTSPAYLHRRNAHLQSVTKVTAPSASPTVFNEHSTTTHQKTGSQSRVPLSFKPLAETINIKQEPSSTPSPLVSRNLNAPQSQSPPSSQHITGSSDTEDDSQAIYVPSTHTHSGKPVIFKVPAPPPTSGPSYWDDRLRNPLHASLPPRPSFVQKPAIDAEPSRRRTSIAEPMRSAGGSETPSSSSVRARINGSSVSAKGKGKETDENMMSTPLTTKIQPQKRIEDYSAFKGRGRYGKSDDTLQPTINAMYTIDPQLNDGLNYQFEEVVRRKDERRKLDAVDCECCREYYKSIGPLPNRLQPPLWRSPPPTPAQPCPRHTNSHSSDERHTGDATRSEIEGHKKAISRHRQNWARAKTPPGYWNIGFPDTQEVGDINEKAKEMHKRKQDDIDREAAGENGRYRRK